MLLDEYEATASGQPVPMAFMCVLDNHPTRQYNLAHLQQRLAAEQIPDPRVRLLFCDSGSRPIVAR